MEDTRLSYSSWSQLQTCEAAYAHRKVYKTKVDNEEEDRTAFDVGSATHECMELTKWGIDDLTQNIVNNAVEKYKDAEPHKALVHAMALKLINQQKMSGLICVKAEQQISSDKYNGFIDLIARNRNGDWYIIDLKTSAQKPNDGLIARLPMDRQLNLYSYFADKVATHYDLDIRKFKGCVYRVVTKSKAVQKSNESYKAFVNRLYKSVRVYDVIIPIDKMNPKDIWEQFEDAYFKSKCIRDGEVPIKNLGACFNYFKTCPYFSQCHGYKAEDIVKEIKVKTNADYESELLDLEDL